MNTNQNLKIGIVISEFNGFIGKKLLKGCLVGFKQLKIEQKNIEIRKVPGAFEIPLMAKKMVQEKFSIVIALGCVIRGETYHFDHVCRACVDGIMQVQLESGIPIVYEVLMVDKLEHALKRASDKLEENKGYIAAMTVASLLDF